MNKMIKVVTLAVIGLLAAPSVFAEDATASAEEAIKQAIKQSLPSITPDEIRPTPIKGLYEVMAGAKVFYISEDGNYVVQGSMVDLKTRNDLTEPRMAEGRVNALKKVGLERMIVFRPKETKHAVYVFTDIDCGYCRKLHSEIDAYLKEGIEIRYLFFPRAGEGSESWRKAAAVWCAKDRNAALTKAKKGDSIDSKPCDDPIAEHMKLVDAFGASGTPMIVTESGHILPGYVSPLQLSRYLNQAAHKS